LDEVNLLNKPFSWEGKVIDSIGIGLSRDKLMYFMLEEFPVKGLVCSTNTNGDYGF